MPRFSIFRAGRVTMVALLAIAVPGARSGAQTFVPPAGPACDLPAAGTGKVRSVRDGRTVTLADGRELRLAGLEIPPVDVAAADARDALEKLALDRDVVLKKAGPEQDRHGRAVAYLVVETPDGERAAQDALVAAGHALVASRVGDTACARRLQAIERAARAASRGLWALPRFRPLPAAAAQDIARDSGEFRLVTGKVLSVRESGAIIYMNFGRRWSRDFSITMLKRNQRLFAAAGIEPKRLEGRELVVRGIIERRGGPVIEAIRPEQIEILD